MILDSEIIFFGLDWGKITSYEQNYFEETNNRLCKVRTVNNTYTKK